MRQFFLVILGLLVTSSGIAQTGQFKEIELDIPSKTTLQPVPFDEPFIIKGKIPGAMKVTVSYSEFEKKHSSTKAYKFTGTADNEGNFKVFFNRLIDPKGSETKNPSKGNRGKYILTVQYSRKIPPETITIKKGLIASKIDDYLIANLSRIENQDVINAELIRDLQGDFAAIIAPSSEETITPSSGTIFDPSLKDSDVPKVIASVANLFENVSNWSSRVKEIIDDIEKDPAFQSGGDFEILLASSEFKAIASDGGDKAAQQFVQMLLDNPSRAIECIPRGSKFNDDGSLLDCDILAFKGTEPLVLAQKAENYLRTARSLNRAAQILENKGHVRQADFAKSIARKLDLLARQSVNLKRELESRKSLLSDLTDELIFSIISTVTINGGFSDGTLQTRSMSYISLDAGAFIAPRINEILPYIGVNLYFRPVKKSTSFESLRTRYNTLFWHRFAATVGFTPTSLSRNDRINTDVFLGRAVITGIGIRINEFIRFGGGALWIKQKDVNPLVTEYKRVATPYISLSIDLDVLQLFSSQIK